MSSPASSDAAHPQGSAPQGGADHLVKMANDIGNLFRGEPTPDDSIGGIANHIAKFWTKRMREKIERFIARAGDGELDELPRAALRRLSEPG